MARDSVLAIVLAAAKRRSPAISVIGGARFDVTHAQTKPDKTRARCSSTNKIFGSLPINSDIYTEGNRPSAHRPCKPADLLG